MKKIIIFSLLLSLPINIFGFIWLNKTLKTYILLEKFKLTPAKGEKLVNVGTSIFYDMKYDLMQSVGNNAHTDVSLIINDDNKRLDDNLPLSGGDYLQDSYLIIDNNVIKGKARLRGDHLYHWAYPRKSWRFKTSKQQTYTNIHKYNLIIPKSANMLLNHMSYQLAKTLGLLAPESRIVELSINGKYNGSRLLVEQIDENFLRNNNRMPQDIYRGDNIGQNTYIGIDVLLFKHASIWQKSAHNNHYPTNNRWPLNAAITALNTNSHDIYDLNSFAKMAAYIDLTGSYHHDRSHNWMLSYDNYLEKMYPIIWDTVGWADYSVKFEHMNIANSELMQSLYFNYDFLRGKYRVLNNFFNQQQNIFTNKLEESLSHAKNIIKNNGYTFTLQREALSQKQGLESIDALVTNMNERMARVKNYFIGDANSNDYKYAVNTNNIRLSLSGSKLVKGIKIKFKNIIQTENISLSYNQDNQHIEYDITNQTTHNDKNINIEISLLANTRIEKAYNGSTKIGFNQATYNLNSNAIKPDNIESVSLIIDNVQNQQLQINRVEHIDEISFNAQLSHIITKPNITKTIVWSGKKQFEGFTIIKENIIIEKGTKLIFEQGASLKVLGKVMALGTKLQPIIFQALDSTQPWGAFTIKDEKANGSEFKYVIFSGGSGDKGDLHEYTGMLSIHNVKGVSIENSEFRDSAITDDMVHLIYSEVKLSNTKFIHSKSDALDVDISDVVIDHCQFINSGNDAIDLMNSNALITNSQFRHSADKGISIGEGSHLLAINNLIENNEIGIQSKDASLAYIYNSSFINNKKAIDAYHKNWRYSQGGTIYLDKIKLLNNEINTTVGKNSQVIINDSSIDTPGNFNAKKIRKNKIVFSNNDIIPYNLDQPFLQGHNHLINKHQKGYHE